MSEPTHSLLPWRVARRGERGDRIAIIAIDGDLVAERIYLEPIDGANFHLIIATVNSHAELLAAAKEALGVYETMHAGIVSPYKLENCIEHLTAAIGKGEELGK